MGKVMETKSTYKDSNRETNTKSKGQEKTEQLNSQRIEDQEEKLETHKDGKRKGLQGCWGTGG